MVANVRMMVFVTCIAVLAGCSRERQDWQSAQTADTIEAYGDFLAKHGDSALATQAEARVKQLGEERDWQQAATLDTLAAYQAYVRQHPEGKWAGEARIRIENFALSGATPSPAVADVATVPAAVTVPAAAAPPPAIPPPVAAAPRHDGFGVQLGAFSTEAKAHTEWRRLETSFAGILGGLSPSFAPVKSGSASLFRLRAATASEAKSRSICEALRAKGQACVVVLPVGK